MYVVDLLENHTSSWKNMFIERLKTSEALQKITKTLGICKMKISCLFLEECERGTSVLITGNSWLLCNSAVFDKADDAPPLESRKCEIQELPAVVWGEATTYNAVTINQQTNLRLNIDLFRDSVLVYILLIVRRWYFF